MFSNCLLCYNRYIMLSKNDVIELNIDDITIEGAGIGKHEGMAVFVPGALPGETVRIKVIKLTKSYAVGKLLEILKRSDERVAPFCASFEACGGCTLQHLSYKGQLEYKSRYIKECLKRLGGIEIDNPVIIAADNIRDYRNKASFPVSDAGGNIEAGFYAPRSHSLVAVDCPIQKQSINAVKDAVVKWANREKVKAYDEETNTGTLRHIIGRQTLNGEVMAGVVLRNKADKDSLITAVKGIDGLKSIVININDRKTNAILGDEERVIYGDSYITETFGGLSFRAGLSSFLQVNHEQAEKLYETAMEFAGISSDDIVFDLFCGIGTLSLLAARKAKRVTGIEYVKSAVDNAKENAEINGIDNAEFLAGDAGEMLDEAVKLIGRPDIVILDPPRKGCDGSLLHKLADMKPERIVYVSCNAATLARDAAILEKGYSVNTVIGVDLFPHTTHVETCVLITRVKE